MRKFFLHKRDPVKLEIKKHRGVWYLFIEFEFSQRINSVIQTMQCTWSKTHRAWYVDSDEKTINMVVQRLKPHAVIDDRALKSSRIHVLLKRQRNLPLKHLSEATALEVERFHNYMVGKDYSRNTINAYKSLIEVYLSYFADRDFQELSNDDVMLFMREYVQERNYSTTYKRQMMSAIKLFYRNRLSTEIELDRLPKIQASHTLPKVLSKKEIEKILQAASNLKHKAVLSLMYSAGLRLNEVLQLKPEDIDGNRSMIWVRNGKGKKDRRIKLSSKMLDMLRKYYKAYRPVEYLFEGPAGRPYSSSSVAKILKRYAAKAQIKRTVTCHMLRHSYATHLLESGVDLRYIQELLGHKSSRTTEIYTYVSSESIEKIDSPIDDLDVFDF